MFVFGGLLAPCFSTLTTVRALVVFFVRGLCVQALGWFFGWGGTGGPGGGGRTLFWRVGGGGGGGRTRFGGVGGRGGGGVEEVVAVVVLIGCAS